MAVSILADMRKNSLVQAKEGGRRTSSTQKFVVFCCCIVVMGGLVFTANLPACAEEVQPATHKEVQVPVYEIPDHLTEKERKWFITFQEGNFLSQGWQAISAEIMAKTPPAQQPEQKIALAKLGNKIGTEWCRPNAVRRVNSSMLKEWGDILRKTAKKKPQQLTAAIAYINQEVDAVLD
jgi:hypothetical protein